MNHFLNRIAKDLTNKNLERYWPNFELVAYALYDKNSVFLFNHPRYNQVPLKTYKILKWDKQFVGNTLILFDGYPTAIADMELYDDYEGLFSILVHELFHGNQYIKEEKRFPDEILGITYPLTKENVEIRNRERKNLYNALLETHISKKKHYLKKFISLHSNEVSVDKIFMWYDIIVKAFDLSIYIFIQEYHKNTQEQLNAQKELINELSSPVIMLQNKVALLPLVGDIGTVKSQFILENTLQQCSEKGVEHLCIDLLGVATIDTMMAQEIFNLVKALRLIGVQTILSGIRPEISQTAIRLGLSFEHVKTTSSLAQALNSIS
ncbi:STAS domain-containing protein [Priestia megaterium]|uniref:STAS domain-containing protein n=2 Tax=Priestia megaterium TaxID=1404 RepID=UPI003390AC95